MVDPVKKSNPGDSKQVEDALHQAKQRPPGGLRQQHIEQREVKRPVQVIDTRTRPARVGGSGVPVRTVIYVEVGSLHPEAVHEIVKNFHDTYEGVNDSPHYILPVRGGKLSSELQFEQEFLKTVRQVCEFKDGEIVLKDGAQAVRVMRSHVDGEPAP